MQSSDVEENDHPVVTKKRWRRKQREGVLGNDHRSTWQRQAAQNETTFTNTSQNRKHVATGMLIPLKPYEMTTTNSVRYPWRTQTTTYSDKETEKRGDGGEVTSPEITLKYFTKKDPRLIGNFYKERMKVTGYATLMASYEDENPWESTKPMVTTEDIATICT